MQLDAVGYGAGHALSHSPTCCGSCWESAHGTDKAGTLDLLETNIDDMNPEIYGYLFERVLAAGALDVYLTPVVMKKNRPGVLLSVLCRPNDAPAWRGLLFSETSTLGIRTQRVARHALPRTSETVQTPFGQIRIKVCRWGDAPEEERAAPEYEDCARAGHANAQYPCEPSTRLR